MFTRIKYLAQRMFGKTDSHRPSDKSIGHQYGSLAIEDESVIEEFRGDPNNTFLVSFPRTGSHWLRMLMELYFGRPSLVRVFYYPDRNNYLSLHTHDLDLSLERSHVIYLYRDPVHTIYSQLRYYKESPNNLNRVMHWTDLYGRHLDKWLFRERFSTHKTILTYESMTRDLDAEFAKVTNHFGELLDKTRLDEVARVVNKDEVKRRTQHDLQVIQLRESYKIERQEFQNIQGPFVWEVLTRNRSHLLEFFSTED